METTPSPLPQFRKQYENNTITLNLAKLEELLEVETICILDQFVVSKDRLVALKQLVIYIHCLRNKSLLPSEGVLQRHIWILKETIKKHYKVPDNQHFYKIVFENTILGLDKIRD